MARIRVTSACWLSGVTARTSRQMLSAELGSLMTRYRSAFCRAAGMASLVMGLGSSIVMSRESRFPAEKLHQFSQRIKELIHHPLLERNDRIIRDRDMLRTDLGAALGDVAEADSVSCAQLWYSILHVQRVHLQRRHVHQEAGPDEILVEMVVPQHMADVLAEEA